MLSRLDIRFSGNGLCSSSCSVLNVGTAENFFRLEEEASFACSTSVLR